MTQKESADLGTAKNPSMQNQETSALLTDQNLTNILSEKFLSGEEQENSNSQTEETAETETAEQENTVLSNDKEEVAESEDSTDSEETEETKSEDEDTDRGLPKGVKKRIDKLSAKRREAEAEVDRLKSEVERLSQEANKPAQTPTKDNPYAHLSTLDEVNREIVQAKQIRRWCEMNPDGAVVKGKNGEETDYTAEEVRSIKVKSMDALEEHLPRQTQYLQNFNQIEQVASKEYPWWKDKAARERQMAETFLKAFPEIKKFPDYKMVIGDYIRGVKGRENANSKNTPITKAPSQPRMSASPARVSNSDTDARRASQRYASSNRSDDLASIISQRFL